jgi:serine/threonine protein kinase/tetratricopeptide (TPR) repeat protein
MTPSKRWQQVESLFHAALMRGRGERVKFLKEACTSDETLLSEVESLIAAHERTGPTDIPMEALLCDLTEEEGCYLPPGQTVAHYRIVGLIGKGGMGTVYKAEDTRLMRTVAMKAFPRRGGRGEGSQPGHLREARAGSAINHPNIVTIHEVGETAEITYIIMEYLEAQSLDEMIESRSLDAGQILSVAMQVCDALTEVHSREIIHRDLKPANVMVSGRGQVKLLDFGIARPFQAAVAEQGEPDEVVGTICYMSPEQIRGESLDERTDIFSFGVLLYEMVTGRVPFAGERPLDVAAAIIKTPPAPFGGVAEGLPRGVCDLAMKCLEKEREKRPRSFTEVRKELEALRLQAGEAAGSAIRAMPEFNYTPVAPAHPIILILPIESVGQPGGEALGLGLSYIISTSLAKVKGLSVISKAAVERQTERLAGSARELARELGATLMMEGEMMSLGDGYAIMLRLSDLATGHIIWGSQYFCDSSDLFLIQQALCKEVASALKIDLSPSDQRHMAHLSPDASESFGLYSQARALLDRYDVKQNVGEAIRLLERLVGDDPAFALAFAALSEAYWHKYLLTVDESWVRRAIAACDRALVLDPHQPEVHISLANIYYHTGRLEQAIESFRRATEIQPTSDRALRGLGWCYQKKGDLESSVTYLERAIASRPGCWYYYNDLGKCYYSFGLYDEAAEQFRRVIAVQPDTYNGYNNLGAMYCMLGLYEDAIVMHRRAIEIQPSEEAYSNLGTEYFHLGRFEEAAREYGKAIDLFPGQDIFHFNLGEAYLQLGRAEEALGQYEQARRLLAGQVKVKKGEGQLHGRLALYLAKLGRHEEALHSIACALALEPLNPYIIFQQSLVYALAGKTEQAIESLRAAIERGYSKTEAINDPNLKSLWQDERAKSLLDL